MALYKWSYTLTLTLIQCTRMSHRPTSNIFISHLIPLSGDIQSSPGPVSRASSLIMCSLNILTSSLSLMLFTILYIADLADTHNIDFFALTET